MKRLRILFLLTLSLLAGTLAVAQGKYPDKPIKLVVGFAAGGPTDIVGRVLAQHLGERLGQSVVVENRAGAAGSIGAAYVAKLPADGYALYLAVQTTHAVAPYLYPAPGYDPIKDFTGIGRIAQNPLVMVVNPALPVKNLAELVAYVKAHPGKLTYATGGSGSSPHMSMEMFKKAAGLAIVPVHYKGDSAAIADLLGGRVDMMMSSISGQIAQIDAGKMRPIAMSGPTRSPQLPDVPTIAESGYPGFEVLTWFGLVAPAKTPPEVVERLNREMQVVLDQPDVRKQFTKLGFDVMPSSPREFTAYIAEEATRWGNLVRALDITVN
ncbi:Argininosuccinate lyase [Variovorax sp. PBS-H4]|uniref:Bug family tripartite tricarboxylate transporter substrate binding protein n=1 Tax=Variovorax sp. PBS-H4 TaxID=434008 RepID=UPI0013180765|nr:tripartite tricarboxylate transporter substrate binding protein [Variovorax sp. PBS-H4]VTU36585.1 Argininosuccinate lyase [Variovorax sp. PBS-H4]